MSTERLCALWHGGDLSYIEELCLTSMVDTGHRVALYTYNDVYNIPTGIDQRDAREVMPEEKMLRHNRKGLGKGSFAIGSDIFRYLLLQKGLGCWVDCDMLFLRPLPQSDYHFGWERPGSICNAVLKLPIDSPVLAATLAIAFSDQPVLPWWGPVKRRRNWLKGKIGIGRKVTELPWGAIGPKAITHFAVKQDIVSLASPFPVFYPNPPCLAPDAFSATANFKARLTPDTIAVHLWKTELKEAGVLEPQEGSWIDRQCDRLGIFKDQMEDHTQITLAV